MNRIALALAASAALVSGPALQARDKLAPEARLAKILDGRVAGEPVNCIYLPGVRETRVIDKTAIVYKSGSTIYVNRPVSGADRLDDSDIMVTRPTGSQLCSVDTVNIHDQGTHFWRGFVGLGEFVPYTRVPAARRDAAYN
jgi:hypothetical protein